MSIPLGGGTFNRSDTGGGDGFGSSFGNTAFNPEGSLGPDGATMGMGAASTQGTGSGSNPYIPAFPTGTSMPPANFPSPAPYPLLGSGDPIHDPNSTYRGAAMKGSIPLSTTSSGSASPTGGSSGAFPANGAPTQANPFSGVNIGGFAPTNGLPVSGMSSQAQSLLYNFLASGAGFSPQAISALISALQPQIERGQENLMEQFSSMGVGTGSPAAIGLADYNSQAELNEGQLITQMYESSISNYLSALGLTKTNPLPSGLGQLIGGIGSLIGGVTGTNGIPGLNGGSGSGSGGGSSAPSAPGGLGGTVTTDGGSDGGGGGDDPGGVLGFLGGIDFSSNNFGDNPLFGYAQS
jgi:hypothetical protein